MLYYNIAPEPVPRMDEARRKLEEAILRYETIIVQIEELWETRVSRGERTGCTGYLLFHSPYLETLSELL